MLFRASTSVSVASGATYNVDYNVDPFAREGFVNTKGDRTLGNTCCVQHYEFLYISSDYWKYN